MRTVGPLVLRSFFSRARHEEGRQHRLHAQEAFARAKDGRDCAWFHAASVGELESLWPVILDWLRFSSNREVVVTIFSESARLSLEKLRAAIEGVSPGRGRFLGYAPWEGSWECELRGLRPRIFVTAKYEAWPDLWASLARVGIPLAIVGARPRRSLMKCASFVRALGLELPELRLLAATARDVVDLERAFPGAQIRLTGEPRWDQVKARADRGSARARELTELFRELPRPWGILAQVWPSDLAVWEPCLSSVEGTVWIVPHRVDRSSVEEIEGFLLRNSIGVLRTSRASRDASGARVRFLLVDEMGFLLELYSQADWAFVGGGFGKVSMHSTIEPAIHGLPISVGPRGREKFPEIEDLLETGELKIVDSREELTEWLRVFATSNTRESVMERRAAWKAQNQHHLGASRRVLEALG
ncbi:MAG: hypothetical protein NDJ89_09870 [Oligoflexia bacterium]|nr:hypothetical protein [Oligoflexia bacterium]